MKQKKCKIVIWGPDKKQRLGRCNRDPVPGHPWHRCAEHADNPGSAKVKFFVARAMARREAESSPVRAEGAILLPSKASSLAAVRPPAASVRALCAPLPTGQ